MKEALILMARAPIEGTVKSRLVGDLSPAEVCTLYLAFLRDTFAVMEEAREEREDLALVLCHTPDDADEAFEQVDHDGCLILPQGQGDLGDRLTVAFSALFAAGCERVVAIGADTPHLPSDYLLEAFEALETGAAAVIGPTGDHGFYLIGLTRLPDGFFADIEWGTERVLARTLQRLDPAGLATHHLPPLNDIDTPRDLAALGADPDLKGRRAQATRRTLKMISAARRSS